jgi:hypothetical protein
MPSVGNLCFLAAINVWYIYLFTIYYYDEEKSAWMFISSSIWRGVSSATRWQSPGSRYRSVSGLTYHIQLFRVLTAYQSRGSVFADPCLWLMDPDPDTAIFAIDLQKQIICQNTFLLITFWRHIYIIFKDKKSKRSHKTVGYCWNHSFFFLFLLDDRRIQEAQNHTDPDPQHCRLPTLAYYR